MANLKTGERSGLRPALVVEGDEAYAAVIAACLHLAGCRPALSASPESALTELERRKFDLVIWRATVEDAARRREILFEIRVRTHSPLIMIDGGADTAQPDLEGGADQWLPDPFVPGALVGAVRAALRRSAYPTAITERYELRGIALDGRARTLSFAGACARLTRQEWGLFSILINHAGRFLSASEIVHLGWRAGEHEIEQVRTYIRRLRNKFEQLHLPCELLSEHGLGYCLSF
jgi:DNA-binding response OmpR family regulator